MLKIQEKKMWVRKIFQERSTKGEFNLLIRDLRLHDAEYYFKYFRMNVIQYTVSSVNEKRRGKKIGH